MHDETLLERDVPTDPSSSLGSVSHLRCPTTYVTGADVPAISALHLAAAFAIGIDPNDECLHWFHEELLPDFLPTPAQLVRFEDRLLRKVSKVLIDHGRHRTLEIMEKRLGEAGPAERRDWIGIATAPVRDLATLSTDDDRVIMVARLERLIRKAEAALDVRLAASISRQLAAVQGLTFQDQDQKQKELLLLLSQSKQVRSIELAKVPPPTKERA